MVNEKKMKKLEYFRKIPTSTYGDCISFNEKYYCIICRLGKTKVYDRNTHEVVAYIKGIKNIFEGQFLSDEELFIKSNIGDYFIFDISKKDYIWKYKVRPLDTFDNKLIIAENNTIFEWNYCYAERPPYKGIPFFLNYKTNEVNLLKGIREPEWSESLNGWNPIAGRSVKSNRKNHCYFIDSYNNYKVYDIDFENYTAALIFNSRDILNPDHSHNSVYTCDYNFENVVVEDVVKSPVFDEVLRKTVEEAKINILLYNTKTREETMIDSSEQPKFSKDYSADKYFTKFSASGRYLAIGYRYHSNPYGHVLRIYDTVEKEDVYCEDVSVPVENIMFFDTIQWCSETLYFFTEKDVYYISFE